MRARTRSHTHSHTHTHTHTCTHTPLPTHGHSRFRRGALGGCVFSSEENLTTMISTEMAADIMNWAFLTEFCMFKVKKSKFKVMIAIASYPVETFRNDQNTHKNKNKMVP